MRKIFLFVFLGAMLAGACGRKGDAHPLFVKTAAPQHFNGAQRCDYLAAHYWDKLNPSVFGRASDSIDLEYAYIDFLDVAWNASPAAVDSGVKSALTVLAPYKEAYSFFLELAYKYLYEADSRFENEEMLRSYLDFATSMNRPDDYIRMRAEYINSMVSSNTVGSKATDFSFILRNGKESTLYSMPDEEMLLVFYDPECPHCTEIVELLSREVKELVLAVYTEGKDSVWQATKDLMPSDWTVGMTPYSMSEADLFDLKAMPTVYVLDRDKTILSKNARFLD